MNSPILHRTPDQKRHLLPAPDQLARDNGQRRLHHRPLLGDPADEPHSRPVRLRVLQPRLQGLQWSRGQEARGFHHLKGGLHRQMPKLSLLLRRHTSPEADAGWILVASGNSNSI